VLAVINTMAKANNDFYRAETLRRREELGGFAPIGMLEK
jgi:hypothetical protein